MEEDDDFLSLGTEVWEYDIADGLGQEFEDAWKNSQMVMEFEVLDDSGEVADLPERPTKSARWALTSLSWKHGCSFDALAGRVDGPRFAGANYRF